MKKPSFVLPSTRNFVSEFKQSPHYSLFNLIHGYFYARWIYFYIGMGTGQHPLAKRFSPLVRWIGNQITRSASAGEGQPAVQFQDTYHGKVVPLQAARELVSVKENINLGDLEHIIPYSMARDIVLKNPDHIVVMDCPCRVTKTEHCEPVDVCLVIGEPFAGLVLEHHPKQSRAISSNEAVEIIEAEDKRGHVHHAFFKDAMIGRFYAICNCCSCCCAAMNAHRHGTPMLASSGYVAEIDPSLCRECGKCVRVCPFDALSKNGSILMDSEKCMGCGLCMEACRYDAIHLVRVEARGEPLEIQKLISNLQG